MDFLYQIDNILTQEECDYYKSLFDDPNKVEYIENTREYYLKMKN